MIENLESELLPHLREAIEIHVAVALMKHHGLETLEKSVPEECFRKYLVGTHLPTPPEILQRLLELESHDGTNISSRVHISHSNYHPKVYIIRKKNDRFIAFIGSANATKGGFNGNVEMSTAIEDQERCKQLLAWFEKLFGNSSKLSQDFIERYKAKYVRNKQLESAQRANNQQFSGEFSEQNNTTAINPGQFFNQSDFDAFAPVTHFRKETAFVDARGRVREKMIRLHSAIFDQFVDYGMMNIYPAINRRNYTSQHFHSRGNDHIPKESIWFNYGKRRNDFVRHLRVQIILQNSTRDQFIGFWLFGDRNTSFADRNRLQQGLNNHGFAERFYKCLLLLGAYYWVCVNNRKHEISTFSNKEELIDFIKQDQIHNDLIIGRNYRPNHPDVSIENIQETTLIEFSKLYKIYALMTENVN